MSNLTKVSVIVPVYNVEAYLPFAMQSLIDQTLRDVEFICVNDGSTDNSLEILEKYASLDDRIVIINKPNGGLSSARNAGIRASCGEIIMFLDSDDYLDKHACERVWIEGMEASTDIIVFGTEIVPAKPEPDAWYDWSLHISTKRYSEFDPNILFYQAGSTPFVWRQAFSRRFLEKTGVIFDETVKFGEDTVFQMEVFPFATSIAYISDRLYNYRWCRGGSLMSKFNGDEEHKIAEHLIIARKIFDFWRKNNIFAKYGAQPLAWFIDFAGWQVLNGKYVSRDEMLEVFANMVKEFDLEKNKDDLDKRQKKLFKRLMSKK